MSPITRKWVSTLLSVGLSVPVALAPLLGKVSPSSFGGLLALVPLPIREVAIPLSCIAVALAAAFVELRVFANTSKKALQHQAMRSFYLCAILVLAFAASEMFLLKTVTFDRGQKTHTFVVGFYTPHTPPCEDSGVENCLKNLTYNPGEIESHFGDIQLWLAKLVLVVVYAGIFAAFGNLIGILVILQTKGKNFTPRARRSGTRGSGTPRRNRQAIPDHS